MMNTSRNIHKCCAYCNKCSDMAKPSNYHIPVTNLLPSFNAMSQPVDEVNLVSDLEDDEIGLESTRAAPSSRPITSTSGVSTSASTPIAHTQPSEVQAPDRQYTNFYKWLMTTVILDDLSFRQPFTNPAQNASRLTEQNLLHHGVNFYQNVERLEPQELVNLPFIPRSMCTGETMLDIPFLDPLLVVLGDIHIEDLHWMLNVLPWRVVDRPIRTGRSLLAWILGIRDIHKFLESTRAPITVTVKIIRFLDNYFE